MGAATSDWSSHPQGAGRKVDEAVLITKAPAGWSDKRRQRDRRCRRLGAAPAPANHKGLLAPMTRVGRSKAPAHARSATVRIATSETWVHDQGRPDPDGTFGSRRLPQVSGMLSRSHGPLAGEPCGGACAQRRRGLPPGGWVAATDAAVLRFFDRVRLCLAT